MWLRTLSQDAFYTLTGIAGRAQDKQIHVKVTRDAPDGTLRNFRMIRMHESRFASVYVQRAEWRASPSSPVMPLTVMSFHCRTPFSVRTTTLTGLHDVHSSAVPASTLVFKPVLRQYQKIQFLR